MGYIRETPLKKGGVRYQAEVCFKGMPKALTAVFDRENDAKAWIYKREADIRCGRHQLYSEGKRHTFSEGVERYFKEVKQQCFCKFDLLLLFPWHLFCYQVVI